MEAVTALDAQEHILNESGDKVLSRVIMVRPGQAALLSLTGMQDNYKVSEDKKFLISTACITIKRVSMGGAEIRNIDRECGNSKSYSTIADTLLRTQKVTPYDVYQCGESWSISPCSNLKLIDVPGFYVAELGDLTQLEELRLEYSILSLDQASSIQSDIRLGA